jgi:hypothetical protein
VKLTASRGPPNPLSRIKPQGLLPYLQETVTGPRLSQMKTIQIHTPSCFKLCYISQLSPHLFRSVPVKDSSFLLHDAVSIAEYLQNNKLIDESARIAQLV